jgi:hypothetical protein
VFTRDGSGFVRRQRAPDRRFPILCDAGGEAFRARGLASGGSAANPVQWSDLRMRWATSKSIVGRSGEANAPVTTVRNILQRNHCPAGSTVRHVPAQRSKPRENDRSARCLYFRSAPFCAGHPHYFQLRIAPRPSSARRQSFRASIRRKRRNELGHQPAPLESIGIHCRPGRRQLPPGKRVRCEPVAATWARFASN